MEVAGAAPLQELFVSTHGDAESVDHLVLQLLGHGEDFQVLSEQSLDLSLKQTAE